jgi:crotonobetainyl-CoA:carnitine CoA-transferase CaiB-like acyl-CoA transferase
MPQVTDDPRSTGSARRGSVGSDGPLAGVRVVEVALGLSVVGAGMASSLPGALLRDLGADVVRVESVPSSTLDSGMDLTRSWNRGKERVEVGPGSGGRDASAADVVRSVAKEADIVLLAGSEDRIEGNGIGCPELARSDPRLIGARIRPGTNARGPMADVELLVQARAGLLSQIPGHRPGPVFGTLPVANAGAALSATVGVLALLHQREVTGRGGWAETSLYDGLQALLPMIIGRVEHNSPSTTLLWHDKGPTEGLAYRCSDDQYLQLWFGARGAYEAFLEQMDEPPSEHGYNADLVSGAMTERSERWASRFATRERAWWLKDFAGESFRVEPVLRPGEALLDADVRALGLAVDREDPIHGTTTVVGRLIEVTAAEGATSESSARRRTSTSLLSDVRVLDLSAFLAGPITPLVLAELGAEVVKVESVSGDVHRNMEPMYAAGQRGKKSVALDLKAPEAGAILERLIRASDVVHHNSRVGVAERLGFDEATARSINADIVYSFASGFGATGPRATLPANDHLMQALSGAEAAQGGSGRPPTFVAWGAIDVTGGWLAACGVIAGLYARRRTGAGQSVSTSLLGASLGLQSGAFATAGRAVGGPVLDAEQTGYGAAYRLYCGGDGEWFAIAVADERAWEGVRTVVAIEGLPSEPPPLRTESGDPQPAEALLETAFAARPAAEWVAALGAAGVPVEPVPDVDRSTFTAGFVDDPVNLQLGRVVTYPWGARGRVDQPRFPPRIGPEVTRSAPSGIAALGEHTDEVLTAVGVTPEELARYLESEVVASPSSG